MAQITLSSRSNLSHLLKYALIVATTPSGGIGKEGQLPWPKLPSDLKWFRDVTSLTKLPSKKNAVIMGRVSWNSIEKQFRPLRGRINVIITSHPEWGQKDLQDTHFLPSIDCALEFLGENYGDALESVFFIGGAGIYEEVLSRGLVNTVYLTRVMKNFSCDRFLPPLNEKKFKAVDIGTTKVERGIPFDFVIYNKDVSEDEKANDKDASANPKQTCEEFSGLKLSNKSFRCCPGVLNREHEELQYLDIIDDIINSGCLQKDRTGVGSYSVFGRQMRFQLKHSFPLFTTKRVFWRGVVEELLWFISGKTDGNMLLEKNIKIWEKHGSREYLDSINMTDREVGDLGPVYGFQWRHYGAKYTSMREDYSGQGVDQLQDCIQKIKNNPDDRRIIMTAWNPAALHEMALPPCHMFCQFHVANGELSCLMYQRSCDMGLGVPFNVASYSLLLCMMAQVCGLRRGELVHVLGNAHVYLNHIDPLKEQLNRVPRPFPVLNINPEIKDIDSFSYEDFTLEGYFPCSPISMQMAV